MTFVEFVDKNITPVKLKEKRSSLFMRFLGSCLNLLQFLGWNVPSKRRFMDHYTTTVRKTIYYSGGWPGGEKVTPLVVHELCHVLQFRSALMPLRYLFSQKWRIYYEATCVQAEVLCFPEVNRGASWFDNKVCQFTDYGIQEKIVYSGLLSVLRGIQDHKINPEAKEIFRAYNLYKSHAKDPLD